MIKFLVIPINIINECGCKVSVCGLIFKTSPFFLLDCHIVPNPTACAAIIPKYRVAFIVFGKNY